MIDAKKPVTLVTAGAAVGLFMGALTNFGILPLGGIMDMIAGAPMIVGEATEANFETYESPKTMAAFMNAKYEEAEFKGLLLQGYGVRAAEAIRQTCGPQSVFTTAEVNEMESVVRGQMYAMATPEAGLEALKNGLMAMAEIYQNPRAMEKYAGPSPEEIGMMAQTDGMRFAGEYGCDSGLMERFGKNLRAHINANP